MDNNGFRRNTRGLGGSEESARGASASFGLARASVVLLLSAVLALLGLTVVLPALAQSDTTAPDTTITSGPSGSVASGSASFFFASSETGSTFECSLDSGAFVACASPKGYTNLGTGEHTFRVRAKDAAGNVDQSPAQRSWTVQAPEARFTWQTAAPNPLPRFEAQGSGASNGQFYVFGGYVTCCSPILATPRSHAYDPAMNAWREVAPMPEALSHSPVVRDGNTLWLVGGFVGDHPGPSTTHVWKYDTASDTWSQGPPLPQPRGAGGAAIVGRTIHFFGGVNRPAGKNIYVDEAEHWALDLDAPNPSWQERAPLPNPRNHMTSAALNGKVYAIGGQHGNNENAGNQAEVDVYDPQTDSWNRAADLPEARGHAVALVMNGRIIVLGGALNGNLKSADVAEYDPASDAWKRLPKLPAARMTPVADAVGDKIIVSTGNGSGPEEETWTALNPAPGTGGECTITGTSANNTLTGTAGADTICAGGGNDTIKGLGGNDTLKGEAGGDKLFGGTGDDTLDGGLGNDTANFSGSLAAVTASLTSGTATGEGSDTLSSVEYLIGSSYGDNLTGNDGINNLKGGGGNDTLGGSGGNDILDGGGGNDTDRGGSGNDSVKGSSGADSLFGDEGGDSLNSQDGVSGNDTLDGGLDTDTCVTDATEKSIENCEQ